MGRFTDPAFKRPGHSIPAVCSLLLYPADHVLPIGVRSPFAVRVQERTQPPSTGSQSRPADGIENRYRKTRQMSTVCRQEFQAFRTPRSPEMADSIDFKAIQ